MTIKTQGDKMLDAPLAQIGGKGLFTKEIEEALLDGRIDLAVHSMKDLPTELPAGLKLAAIMEREDPRDAFVSRDGRGLEELEPGAVVGTSSLRRKAFLLSSFPSLHIVSLRGNLDTRLRKLHTDNLDAVILAAAGIKRMGLADRITRLMDPDMMIPAIGQGALGIETRVRDSRIDEVVSPLNHEETALCVRIERTFLRRMGGGCQVPMAAYASLDGDRVRITAAIVHPEGKPMIRDTVASSKADSEIGTQLADILTERGGAHIMRSVLGCDWKPGPG
jgi:hydroxymethylbilane synthase